MIKLTRASLAKRPRTEGEREFIFVEFNAWLHQGYDDARSALMDVIATKLEAEAKAAVVFVISYLLLYRLYRPARMSEPFVHHWGSAEPMSPGRRVSALVSDGSRCSLRGDMPAVADAIGKPRISIS